jgi:leucyl aminopeptidase
MKITLKTGNAGDASADIIAVLVPTGAASGKGKKSASNAAADDSGASKAKLILSAELSVFDKQFNGGLQTACNAEEFTGKKDQVLTVSPLGILKAKKLVLVGIGPLAEVVGIDLRTAFAKLGRQANAEKGKSLVVVVPEGLEAHLYDMALGLELGAYRFTKHFTGDRAPKAHLASATLLSTSKFAAIHKRAVDVAQVVGAGVGTARDLSNEPPNVIYPESLAEFARNVAKQGGLKPIIYDFKEIKKQGMQLLQAVGQGSVREPRFVHLAYTPATAKGAAPKKKLVFVGKGITFDSGGISIKPAAGMGEMKHDMSGAANIVGLMQIVAALKPDVEVHGIIVAAENMPDGNAYRPGDVWGSLEGKSVEIINTDAEGRLILADALTYAHRLNPDVIVDNATLTGAIVVALGMSCSAYYASNDEVAADFGAAAKAAGEQMWRMPLLEELRDQLKSDVADMKHTGDRYGGSITAALFLREFIGKVKNWVHCDIAGPAMPERAFRWEPKGGTGHAVMTFWSLIEQYQSKG